MRILALEVRYEHLKIDYYIRNMLGIFENFVIAEGPFYSCGWLYVYVFLHIFIYYYFHFWLLLTRELMNYFWHFASQGNCVSGHRRAFTSACGLFRRIRERFHQTEQVFTAPINNQSKEGRKPMLLCTRRILFSLYSTKIQSSSTRIFKYDNGTWLLQNDIHIINSRKTR